MIFSAAVAIGCQRPRPNPSMVSAEFPPTRIAETAIPGAISAYTLGPTACPTLQPDQSSLIETNAITAADHGKTLVIHQTDRFSIYLDNRAYPLNELAVTPDGPLGRVSNGSLRGPDCFPLIFEGVNEGRTLLHDRDFELWVDVDNKAPASTLPLP
jgi:hypothetical protein